MPQDNFEIFFNSEESGYFINEDEFLLLDKDETDENSDNLVFLNKNRRLSSSGIYETSSELASNTFSDEEIEIFEPEENNQFNIRHYMNNNDVIFDYPQQYHYQIYQNSELSSSNSSISNNNNYYPTTSTYTIQNNNETESSSSQNVISPRLNSNFIEYHELSSDSYSVNDFQPSIINYDQTLDSDVDHEISDIEILESQNVADRDPDADESDVRVIESIDRSRLYPRVTRKLVIAVIRKLYFTFKILSKKGSADINDYVFFNVKLSGLIAMLSPDELKYLRDKVSSSLSTLINDESTLKFLMDHVSPSKIDNIAVEDFPQKLSFKASYFKDLLNVECKSCGICYDPFAPMSKCTTLKCLHTFHITCIKKWAAMSYCCPICRTKEIL